MHILHDGLASDMAVGRVFIVKNAHDARRFGTTPGHSYSIVRGTSYDPVAE
jgi:hypothetical protein